MGWVVIDLELGSPDRSDVFSGRVGLASSKRWNGDDRDGSWSRHYLIAQTVIVLAIIGGVAGAILSEDRGLSSLVDQPARSEAPSGGFSIIQPLSAPPTVCPGGPEGEYPIAEDGLADDCDTLLSVQPILAGDGDLDWSVDVPITRWQGVNAGR